MKVQPRCERCVNVRIITRNALKGLTCKKSKRSPSWVDRECPDFKEREVSE